MSKTGWWKHKNHLSAVNVFIGLIIVTTIYFTSSSESVDHIRFPQDQQQCHINTPVYPVKYLMQTHNCSTCSYCVNKAFQLSTTYSSANSFQIFPKLFTISHVNHLKLPPTATKDKSSNKQDAGKAVHCDAISKVQHEDLIYTWPVALNYIKKHAYNHINKLSFDNFHNF